MPSLSSDRYMHYLDTLLLPYVHVHMQMQHRPIGTHLLPGTSISTDSGGSHCKRKCEYDGAHSLYWLT